MKKTLLALLIGALPLVGQAQWQNLNPGGGGQIQGITADPNTPGRMFLNSDVEGNYRSDDYGQSWHYTGKELIHHMAFFTAVEPGNSNRVYCGGLYGLHVSDNGGLNWSVVNGPMKGFGTAAMAIDPTNVNNLYVGNSWYIKDAQMSAQKTPAEATTGNRVVWISKDRGATWQTVTYEATAGYKQCYTITIDPTNTNRVYLGTSSGLYRSLDGGLTWSRISSPTSITPPVGTVLNSCRGADITPDGRFVYAVFHANTGSNSGTGTGAAGSGTGQAYPSVWVAEVNNASTTWTWTQVAGPDSDGNNATGASNGLYYSEARAAATSPVHTYYWKPLIDPRSTATEHKVIIGCMSSNANNRQGLFEFTGTVSGSSVTGSWAMVFGQSGSNGFNFDMGWNNIAPQVRQYTYTPPTWDRRVLLASQQSLYYGNPALPNNTAGKYTVLSTKTVGTAGPYTTYATRGFQSTVNFDGTGLGNYVAQSMADNRILESWDGGLSWTQDSRPGGGQNGDYVDIIPANNGQPPLVLTAAGGGFGGVDDLADASHWAKKLSSPASPTDAWVSLEQGTSGLPAANSRTYGSAYDPFDPKHVILATQNGLYETTDIYARYDNTGGTFQQIGGTVIYKFGGVWFSPVAQDVLFAFSPAQGLIRGTRSGGTWTFTTLIANARRGYYWHHQGRDLFVYLTASQNEVFLAEINSSGTVVSNQSVFNQAQATAVHSEPWFGTWAGGQAMELTFSGLAGFKNELYTGSQEEDGKHGYAMFKGSVDFSTVTPTVTWSYWSGNYGAEGYMEIARLWDAKIVKDGLKTYYYAATRGAGLWRREIEELVPPGISTEPENQSACAGQSASFSVTATGTPPLSYQWYKGTPGSGTLLTGQESATLTLNGLQAADAGTYYCVVSGVGAPATSAAALLTVNSLPSANLSGGATVCNGTGTTLSVSGTPEAIVAYTVNGGNLQNVTLSDAGIGQIPTGTLTADATYALVSVSLGNCTQSISNSAAVTVTPNAFDGPLAVSGAPVCAGQNVTLTFAFTCSVGVSFTAQLSDASGSFANPTVLAAVAPGTTAVQVPASTPAGTGYRIRVLTANPTLTPLVSEPFRINALGIVTVALFPATPGKVCQGETLPVTFSVTGNGTCSSFPADNVFTVQLSSATGSFANPTVLGTALPGTTPLVLPTNLLVGTGYRVRIVSSNPAQTSQASAPFRLEGPGLSVTPGVGQVPVCRGSQVSVSFSLPNGSCAFPEGNQFTAQLSGATGSFASPLELGLVTPGQATALTIPGSVAAGTGYRIRIVSSQPQLTSNASLPFRVNACNGRLAAEEPRLVVQPNPSASGVIRCRVSGLDTPVFGLTNVAGIRLQVSVKPDSVDGYLVTPANRLTPGVYVLEASEGSIRLTQRVVVGE